MAVFGVPAAGAVARCGSLCLAAPRCGVLWLGRASWLPGCLWRTNLILFDMFAAPSSPSHISDS